jgi:hypothetical protein
MCERQDRQTAFAGFQSTVLLYKGLFKNGNAFKMPWGWGALRGNSPAEGGSGEAAGFGARGKAFPHKIKNDEFFGAGKKEKTEKWQKMGKK